MTTVLRVATQMLPIAKGQGFRRRLRFSLVYSLVKTPARPCMQNRGTGLTFHGFVVLDLLGFNNWQSNSVLGVADTLSDCQVIWNWSVNGGPRSLCGHIDLRQELERGM